MYSVALNQDYAVSAGQDYTIQVYSLTKKKTVHTFKHSNDVYCVSFGPVNTDYANKIISSSWDQTVRIWNIENGEMEMEFEHDNPCWSFDIDKDATTLAVAYGGLFSGGVSVWSIRDHKQMANIKTDSSARYVRFNQSEDTIAVGCNNGEIYKITL